MQNYNSKKPEPAKLDQTFSEDENLLFNKSLTNINISDIKYHDESMNIDDSFDQTHLKKMKTTNHFQPEMIKK